MIIHVFFAWLKLILWKAFGFDSKKMKLSKRKQTLAKEKEKEMVEKKHNLRKQLDTIVYPQTRLLCIRVAHGLPP